MELCEMGPKGGRGEGCREGVGGEGESNGQKSTPETYSFFLLSQVDSSCGASNRSVESPEGWSDL